MSIASGHPSGSGAERFHESRRVFIDRHGEGEPPDELAVRAEQNHACGAVDRVIVGTALTHVGVADPEVVGGAALQCGCAAQRWSTPERSG